MDTASLYRLVAATREILMRTWDPIGVADMDWPDDEYDIYIPGVIALLQRGANVSALAAHLDAIATDRMGLSGEPISQRSSAAAQALIAMWQEACGLPT